MRNIVKILIAIGCVVGSAMAYAEGGESLQNVSGSVYGTGSSHSYTGDNGMTWTTLGAIDSSTGGYRTLTVLSTIAGNGITGQLNSDQVEEGIRTISFYVKGMKSGTGYGDRTFRVTAGDVVEDVVINIPSMTNSYQVTATIKRRNVSSFSITSLPSLSDETATFGLYNITWTSYDGKTDRPMMAVDDSQIEYGIEGADTVYYSAATIPVQLSSTSDGATIYYTTDGTPPTTASASGTTAALPAGGEYTIRAIAWTQELGVSDETQMTIKTGRGRIVMNTCDNTGFWAENSGLYTYSNANYQTKSGVQCYRIPGSGQVVTPVVVCPKHLSFYATSSTRTLEVAYQAGTYVVEGGTQTWEGGEWTTLETMSVSNGKFTSGVMKRFDLTLPSGLEDKFVKFKMTASGNSVYLDDANYIYADREQVATPSLSVGSGEVANGQTVSISAEAGASIYYTINEGEAQVYSAPLTINGPTVVRAYAEKSGMARSWSAKATYTVANVQPTLSTPTFSVAAGEVYWGTQVTITADNFATLHYTINGGSEQTATGSVTLTLQENTTLSAYATCSGYTTSATASATYTVVYPSLDAPTFSLESGSVMVGTSLTITASAGASIVYTINGGPNQLALTNASINITEDMTIVAYAQREGYTNSESVTRSFTVTYPKLASPTLSIASGEVAAGTRVEIKGQKGDTLYYTTNGTQWTRALAMANVEITESCTLSAYLCRNGYLNSDTVSATYSVVIPQAAAPVFSLEAGTYAQGTQLTITAAEGATIHYTINSEPEQTAITQVTLTLVDYTEIAAYVTMDGYAQSETIEGAFFVEEEQPTAVDETPMELVPYKRFDNGHLYIVNGDRIYDVCGKRVR